MPGCAGGAHVKPEWAGVRSWLNADLLDVAIQTFLNVAFPSWKVSLAASLVDAIDLCELNPGPPPPFEASLLFDYTQPSLLGPATPTPALTNWIYQWILYQAFLQQCDCDELPPAPGLDCIAPPPSIPIGSLGSIAGPYAVSLSGPVFGAIITHPNGDWTWYRHGSATVDGGAHNGSGLDIQYQATNGTWVTVDSILTLNQTGGFCNTRNMGSTAPRFSQTTAIRIVNNAGGTHTITNFGYCFCALAPTPEPLPPFTPPTGIPAPPAAVCSLDDVCRVVNELMRRLTVVASQVSDVQAALVAGDLLQVVTSSSISGEGEQQLPVGTRGVSIELTALGGEAYTSALGRPRGLMRVGSVRWGSGVGYSPREFIDADKWVKARPSNVTSLSWQLLPGTTGILKMLA